LFADRTLEFRTQGIDRRKAVAPCIRPAGIDDSTAIDEVAGIALVRVHRRIERRAPATVDDTDGGFGIATRRHCPNNVLHIRWIDVVIDDDDEAAMIVAAA